MSFLQCQFLVLFPPRELQVTGKIRTNACALGSAGSFNAAWARARCRTQGAINTHQSSQRPGGCVEGGHKHPSILIFPRGGLCGVQRWWMSRFGLAAPGWQKGRARSWGWVVGTRGGSQPAPVVLSGGHDVAVADFGVLLLCGALGGAVSRGLGSGRAEISAPAADSPPINGGASGEKKRGGIKI